MSPSTFQVCSIKINLTFPALINETRIFGNLDRLFKISGQWQCRNFYSLRVVLINNYLRKETLAKYYS